MVNYPHAASNPDRSQKGRLSKRRKEKAKETGYCSHQRRDGSECRHPVIFEGGLPKTRALDENGQEVLVELEWKGSLPRQNKDGSYRWYMSLRFPCIHGDFTRLYRLFNEDGEPHVNHGEYQRQVPLNNGEFLSTYGKRNITESKHRWLKRERTTSPVKGMALQTVYMSGLMVLINSLEEHRHLARQGQSPGQLAS